MGLRLRLHRLLENAEDDPTKDRIKSSALRLINHAALDGSGGMGEQYKVIGMTCNKEGQDAGTVWPFQNR